MNKRSNKKSKWLKWGGALIALLVLGGIGYGFFNQADFTANPTSTDAKSPPQHAAQPVRVTPALQQPIRAWVFAEGTARSVQREYLTFDRAGRVTFVKRGEDGGDLRAGASVSKGTVLARLDPRQYESEIDSAKATVAEAQAQLDVAQSDITQAQTQYELAAASFRRSETLLGNQAISQEEYEESEANLKNAQAARVAARVKVQALQASVKATQAKLRQAELTLDEIELVSPINGIVAYLNIEEGFYFMQSNIRTTSESEALQTIPIVVIDPSQYEITVDVPAYQANQLAVNQQVLIVPGSTSATAVFEPDGNRMAQSDGTMADGTIDWKARGTVFSINPAVNPGGRSVQVKIRTTGGAEQLKDGMFVACWIEVQNKADAIVAPFDAFLFEENRPYVFVVDPVDSQGEGQGVARRVDLEIGIESLTRREILGEVDANQRLVTEGRYRLVDGAPVRMVNAEEVSSP